MRITQVRSAGRGVVLAVCALVVAGLSGVMAPAASGAAAFFSSLVVPVSGSQAGFSLSGLSRLVLATVPGNACRNLPNAAPTEPCRALTTVASVTGTDATGNACLLSGTDVRAVSVDATAESFTVPPNPILPIDPCRALGPVTLRVSVSIAAGGTLTSASVVGGSVDLLAP